MFLYFNRVVADDMIWDTKHHIHTFMYLSGYMRWGKQTSNPLFELSKTEMLSFKQHAS